MAETFSEETSNQFGLNKELLILVPVLGSALAAIFDVGYFTAINISVFTLFSLNEHIVFALQNLPYALLFAFPLALALRRAPHRRIDDTIKKLDEKGFGWVTIIAAIACFAFIVALVIFFPQPWMFVAAFIAGGLSGAAGRAQALAVRATYILIVVIIVTFIAGYSAARSYLQPDQSEFLGVFPMPMMTTVETTSGLKITGKLIRSGENGILMYDAEKKQVRLLRWQGVSEINSYSAVK